MATADDAGEQLSFAEFAKLREEIPAGLFVVLDHREQAFVLHKIRDPSLNGRRAAELAGYTKRRARQTAHELLQKPAVRAAIDAAITTRLRALAVDAPRIVREVDEVSLSSIEHFTLTEDGQLALAPGAPPHAMRAVRSFKRKVRFVKAKDGVGHDREIESEITLWDKPTTLRLSMLHRGMLGGREDETPVDVRAAAIKAALEAMDAATATAGVP